MEKFVLVPYASYQSKAGVKKSPPGKREKSTEVNVAVKRRERDTANEKNKKTQPLKWIDT